MPKIYLVLLASFIALSGSVVAQQEPLPPIQPKTAADSAATPIAPSDPASAFPRQIIDLPVEPVLVEQAPTLEDSARRNDFATFDALFAKAEARGQAAEFSALHDLWTYSVSDRIGAFYGQEMHDRLARAYSGYAGYIENYRIVDSRGHVFYPTAETKTYLIQQAVLGTAPRTMIASSRRASRNRNEQIPTITIRPSRKRLQKATKAPAELPAELTTTPVVVQASSAPPNVATPVATPAPQPAAPQPVQAVQASLVTTPAPPQEIQSAFNARAIIVAIMIFVGVGVLMVMLRTSREERQQHVLIPPPVAVPPPAAEIARNDIKPLDNIEPIRKKKSSSRASGSRG